METIIPNQAVAAVRGWVLYDGECSLCLATIAQFGPWLQRHRFELTPMQIPWVQKQLGLNPGEPLTEMKLLTTDGQVFGGAEALLQIVKRIWWTWPLFALAQIPGVKILLHAIYRRIAANRTCIGNACQLSAPRTATKIKRRAQAV